MEVQTSIEAREDARELGKPIYAVAIWGVGGFLALIAHALWRLSPVAVEAMRDYSLSPMQIVLYGLWIAFMAYSEGYKGFQLQFAPRMAVRAMYLARNPRPHLVLLAPFVCMGLLHATRRRLIIAWSIVIGIVGLIVLMRQVEQPWRGLVDGGVVVGLAWGSLAVAWYFARALSGNPPDVSSDVPLPVDSGARSDALSASPEDTHS